MTSPLARARFIDRPNRFLIRAELEDGRAVAAHLPNTGRLEHVTEPGRLFLLRHDGTTPARSTEYTATRAWDGVWVALEAGRAPDLLAEWLNAGNPLTGFGRILTIEREVAVANHRLDLRITTVQDETVWVEVKSGSRAVDGAALLSGTPSARGVSHLATLEALLAEGQQVAAAFVIQRSDVERLVVGGNAEPGWITAVRSAHQAGVPVIAYRCDVTESDVAVVGELPVEFLDRPA